MYSNKLWCTVYERKIENHTEVYVPHYYPTVYWEDTKAQVKSGNGMQLQNAILCMIPAKSIDGYMPKIDDLIMPEKSENEAPPKSGYRTIMSVDSLLYGSADVQHIEVTAV